MPYYRGYSLFGHHQIYIYTMKWKIYSKYKNWMNVLVGLIFTVLHLERATLYFHENGKENEKRENKEEENIEYTATRIWSIFMM